MWLAPHMASLTLPVKAWGLLAARAEDRDRVAPSNVVARAMANLEGTVLISNFSPWVGLCSVSFF
jgi:hypothetical protein